LRHVVAPDTEEPELITEDATRLAVPSFGVKKLPPGESEPEKAGEGTGAAPPENPEAVPEDISAFYSKIGELCQGSVIVLSGVLSVARVL
jgi:hypothetical protein